MVIFKHTKPPGKKLPEGQYGRFATARSRFVAAIRNRLSGDALESLRPAFVTSHLPGKAFVYAHDLNDPRFDRTNGALNTCQQCVFAGNMMCGTAPCGTGRFVEEPYDHTYSGDTE